MYGCSFLTRVRHLSLMQMMRLTAIVPASAMIDVDLSFRDFQIAGFSGRQCGVRHWLRSPLHDFGQK